MKLYKLAYILFHNLWTLFFRPIYEKKIFNHNNDENFQRKDHMSDAMSNRMIVRKKLKLTKTGFKKNLLTRMKDDIHATQEWRASWRIENDRQSVD